MRSIIFGLVSEALGEDFGNGDRVFAAGAVQADNLPARPFAVIHLGTFERGMANIKKGNVTIWIHDEGGDYGLIDTSMDALYGRLDGAEHVSEPDGSAELISSSWNSNSGDLFDTGFRTLTKNTTYTIVGRTGEV